MSRNRGRMGVAALILGAAQKIVLESNLINGSALGTRPAASISQVKSVGLAKTFQKESPRQLVHYEKRERTTA